MFSRRAVCLFAALIFVSTFITFVKAKGNVRNPVGRFGTAEIESELQKCSFVQELNQHKLKTAPHTSSIAQRVFAVLFPGSPAINSLLATLYISGPPNFLLALCPPNIDPSSLSVMVAFAVGGLLGDTLFHLLPEIFLGEASPEHVSFVLVEPNRNILLGVAIMVGFITFVVMDKGLRIATAGDEGGRSHSHSHGPSSSKMDPKLTHSSASTMSSSLSTSDGALKTRKRKTHVDHSLSTPPVPTSGVSSSIKLSAYLNLIADFTHNITDGLALSSSFYASPTLGATTTVAVFFHEIPHEVGDFALLIQSGFSKRRAMGAQFVTAVGAFLGTCLGIAVQELGKASTTEGAGMVGGRDRGLVGTGLGWGDLLLPFTAGTFLYVGTVAVIPDLLETGEDGKGEVGKTLKQFLALSMGAGIMLWISWT